MTGRVDVLLLHVAEVVAVPSTGAAMLRSAPGSVFVPAGSDLLRSTIRVGRVRRKLGGLEECSRLHGLFLSSAADPGRSGGL